VEIKELLLPLKKWWWLVVMATVVALVSSYLYTSRQPAKYQSSVTLMVGNAIQNLNPSFNEFTLTQQLASTYVDMVKRGPVREATIAALGLSRLPEYGAYRIDNTQLFVITVVDIDPTRAQAVAAELANQLHLQGPTGRDQEFLERQAFVNQMLDQMQAGIVETQTQIREKQLLLSQLFRAREIADTQAQIGALQNNLNVLQQTYSALLTGTQRGALNTITVIEPAYLPYYPESSGQLRIMLLAAAMGLILATTAGYVLEYLDGKIRNKDEVVKALNIRTMGEIPVQKHASERELAWSSKGHPTVRESYRRLHANLESAAGRRPLLSLIIASPTPKENSAIVAANLGVAMAQAGKRVILIDADIYQPKIHGLFELQNEVGLSGTLVGWYSGIQGLQETLIPGLRLLSAGPHIANSDMLLNSQRLKRLINSLVKEADAVLMNVPPVSAVADAVIWAAQVDGVLLVADIERTERQTLQRAVEQMEDVHAHMVGVVLNRVPVSNVDTQRYAVPNVYSDHKRLPIRATTERVRPVAEVIEPLNENGQAGHRNGGMPHTPIRSGRQTNQ
jgi:polysaccharide biosynthesis transport protein